jgi:hypothetical protein
MLGPSTFRNSASYVEFDVWIRRPLTLRQINREQGAIFNYDTYYVNYKTLQVLPCPRLHRYAVEFTAEIVAKGRGFDVPFITGFLNEREQTFTDSAVQYDTVYGNRRMAIMHRTFSRFHRDTGVLFRRIIMDMGTPARMGTHARRRRALMQSPLGSRLDDVTISLIMYHYVLMVLM